MLDAQHTIETFCNFSDEHIVQIAVTQPMPPLSSMFHHAGQPEGWEIERFKKLLTMPQRQEGGRLSLPLLKSLSSIFNGRGLPEKGEIEHFIELLKLPNIQTPVVDI
ncbi:hypothetical protein D5R81_19360 [Parashewanella spongiae]|uniref:Uncharacterized protein n=1 Tax=Parashewanella spongiae TaxID=342950 RepID=A0A3A6SUP9_9GAMM|nr:hypothetical protein [Parashewanella spongiae]MCL1080180.1 hypothetical protein [Parashewanella spongiae]RJY02326.1 hypothetical protein D5R81_19360 [Parashewanella spongiae]